MNEEEIIFDDSFFEKYKKTEEKFIINAGEIGIYIDPPKMDMFRRYFKMLVETNRVMNLTAITEYEDVLEKHFLDSLLVEKAVSKLQKDDKNIKSLNDSSVIDIGTGAGFPGLPLKIHNKNAKIHLLDSLNKRIVFLNRVIEELELKDIFTYHGRSEDLARERKHRESYDYAFSRAVANLSTLSEYCFPFVKAGGVFISYKAEDIEKEVKSAENAVKKLGGEITDIIRERIPGTDMIRSFVCVKKVKETPGTYPRKAGTPAKEPL
ncbi:MAG: 16S rRNA (guanine(527)-N(7))-methyltransferase RsmG [Clostridiales bacterium]|nr:16S rRNA (guanine(527)-N(7))-methyltransferase RsmG [Clostridiales bacterium]MBS5878341.1 16S rRNA (guanine(527)-N(7))-methyltransferase RsmG [Clostridiales bacterium]MDU0939675.1 16S rRNA (guanine(527)-N(7))-methyltransferase RsmG [Clostridiales bacterium]MDU1042639.1 16S rRNA (guanine(527)-N(7))-methyltransferase RsmG [Clostridiales bacterium]MDU3489986.1 16S rRNA (guanine(527)-N(7))-methyltransferase RsmG [Clostridiales bacterium]